MEEKRKKKKKSEAEPNPQILPKDGAPKNLML